MKICSIRKMSKRRHSKMKKPEQTGREAANEWAACLTMNKKNSFHGVSIHDSMKRCESSVKSRVKNYPRIYVLKWLHGFPKQASKPWRRCWEAWLETMTRLMKLSLFCPQTVIVSHSAALWKVLIPVKNVHAWIIEWKTAQGFFKKLIKEKNLCPTMYRLTWQRK